MQLRRPHQQYGPGSSSSLGHGKELWPQSAALLLGPWWDLPSTTMPAPTPLAKLAAKTTRYPAPAPSRASEAASRSASFTARTSRPSDLAQVALHRLADQPRRACTLAQARPRIDGSGDADADSVDAPDLRLRPLDEGGDQLAGRPVVAARRVLAQADVLRAVRRQRDDLDLGATPIHAHEHGPEYGSPRQHTCGVYSWRR